MGMMHGRKTVDASHEPSLDLDLDPGGESKSKSKSKTTRFMGIMQFSKELAVFHEPWRPGSIFLESVAGLLVTISA
jgi:hypothetical protein